MTGIGRPVRILIGLACMAALAAATVSASAAERRLTRADAEKKCRAELDSFDGDKRRSRTGYSLEQDMAFCIKQKTGK